MSYMFIMFPFLLSKLLCVYIYIYKKKKYSPLGVPLVVGAPKRPFSWRIRRAGPGLRVGYFQMCNGLSHTNLVVVYGPFEAEGW